MRKLFSMLMLLLAFASVGAFAADTPAGTATASPSAAEASAAVAAAAPAASAASAAEAPAAVPNKGDTAWMMVSTMLVIMMVVPGLALFYGGLVRSKNMLSVLMQVMVTFSLIVVLWVLYGYSYAFTEGNAFFGGTDRLFMKGIWDNVAGSFVNGATFSKGVVIPEIVFAAFQATFAGITCCLIVGAFAERMKFAAVLLFMAIWFTFSYIPMAHMVWFWPGPDAYTAANLGRRPERQGRPDLAVGRARLRRRHRGAHQRGRGRSGRCLYGGQTHRLRQGINGAAQPDVDDGGRCAAVGRLVRLQRRLGTRSERLCRAGVS